MSDAGVMMAEDLQAIAGRIPSMGGTRLGPVLRQLARDAPPGTAIVEVGAWFGAGTAQLALGIRERRRPDDVTLHVYDRWRVTRAEKVKAAGRGVRVSRGEDILPRVRRALDRFGVRVHYHQGELLDAAWGGGRISVYVDDASKMPDLFLHAIRTFGPSWIPGRTSVVLMDYGYWRESDDPRHRSQRMFVEFNGTPSSRWMCNPGCPVRCSVTRTGPMRCPSISCGCSWIVCMARPGPDARSGSPGAWPHAGSGETHHPRRCKSPFAVPAYLPLQDD